MVLQSLLLCSATVGAYLAHFIDMLLLMAQFDALTFHVFTMAVCSNAVGSANGMHFLGTLCCLIYMYVHICNY